jgi:hypothetical protein
MITIEGGGARAQSGLRLRFPAGSRSIQQRAICTGQGAEQSAVRSPHVKRIGMGPHQILFRTLATGALLPSSLLASILCWASSIHFHLWARTPASLSPSAASRTGVVGAALLCPGARNLPSPDNYKSTGPYPYPTSFAPSPPFVLLLCTTQRPTKHDSYNGYNQALLCAGRHIVFATVRTIYLYIRMHMALQCFSVYI